MFTPATITKQVFVVPSSYEVKCYLCCRILCLIKSLFLCTKHTNFTLQYAQPCFEKGISSDDL